MQNLLTPEEFVDRWRNTRLNERRVYQRHFIDVCRMVGYEPPSNQERDARGNIFSFEYGVRKTTGSRGFADVYLQNHFAAEYKSPDRYKDLREAYNQLLQYHESLQSPPLLIVTDINYWQIHTKWENTEAKVYEFTHEDIADRPSVQAIIRHAFFEPERLHPRRNTEQVTRDAAEGFRLIAENMRAWEAEPQRIANFLTKLIFCLFAEDISLLPYGPNGNTGIFSEIIQQTRTDPHRFISYTEQLFKAMADGGDVLLKEIPYFNGALFDDIRVEELSLEAMTALENASKLNWESVEPAIFGTLFERSLDPAKRAQLGAHYTSREDIQLIVQPVLMRPLEREWERIKATAAPIWNEYEQTRVVSRKRIVSLSNHLEQLRNDMLNQIRSVKVLDPACGSGNFLYVALQSLMTLEKQVITHPYFQDLDRITPEVHPRQMFGIEKDEIAHALASIVVWIGWLQWRQQNGYGMALPEPILQDLRQNIVCKDAILAYDEEGNLIEPVWAEVDVIIGNPPFLGAKKMRGELGDKEVNDIHKLYEGRLPGFTDLVVYWFERARAELENGRVKRVGLLATNSIGMGTNLPVLQRIKESGDIFMAWRDRAWVLDGAAVRVAMVGFDSGAEYEKMLDGMPVSKINANLTATIDITAAQVLENNLGIAFIGTQKSGSFDISENEARYLLLQTNPTDVNNADVVRPWVNGSDIVRQPRGMYNVYFPADTTEEEAKKYEAPFDYVMKKVQTERTSEHFENYPFWLHWRPRPEMQKALVDKTRYIITPRVAKHRLFVWMDKQTIPDSATVAIARDDDYFFGVLHSKLHEVWSLRMGTSLEDRPRYTPTTTFETFPFPYPPGQEDTNSGAYKAIAAAASQLDEERYAWVNPVGVSGKALNDRTLTNLYNALNVWRGKESIRTVAAAADFAPRLDELHNILDRAVCDAYGWEHAVLDNEEEILRRLLALNLERSNK